MKKILVSLVLALVVLTGCQQASGIKKSDKLQVVATYSIIADMVENIAGDKADVYSMVPIGTDPHMYDPLPKDTDKVSKADLVFYNGLNLETGKGWFNDLLKVTNKEDKAFAVTRDVQPMYLSEKGKETEEDPHAWFDVQNAIKYTNVIVQELIKADPTNKEAYEANHAAYVKELEALDVYAKEQIATLPLDNRTLVTSEGAFKYFSKAYDLQAAYIWEINTDNQGTPEQLSRIIQIINDEKVPVLFVETSVSPKTMETVSRETGVRIHSNVFTDSLAKKGEQGDNYIDMIKWNVDHVVEGLSQ